MPGSAVEQVRITAWVPLAVLSPGSARQPDPGFSSMVPGPSGLISHRCAALPLQVNRTAVVPLMFRHLPWIRTVPSGSASHFCSAALLQAAMTILVPSAVPFPLSSRHLPGIPDATGPAGSSHFWLEFPRQDEIVSCLPLAVLLPGSVRHRPDRGLTSSPPVCSCHRCAVLPLQVYRSAGVPLAALLTRRHLPWIRSVSSCTTVHFCAAEPLQVQMTTLVPFAVLLPLSSRHLPPRFRRTGPAGPLPRAAVTVQVNGADPAVPLPSVAVTTRW